jgi:hypothetical protein
MPVSHERFTHTPVLVDKVRKIRGSLFLALYRTTGLNSPHTPPTRLLKKSLKVSLEVFHRPCSMMRPVMLLGGSDFIFVSDTLPTRDAI